MLLFKLSIKHEKLIGVLNRDNDNDDKPSVTIEIILIICSQIQREEFIIAINIIDLKTNCFGESIFE